MIEQQLKETFERAAAGRPEEAGAYDRFLARRARRARRTAGAAGLALALLLGLVVAVPGRREPDRPPAAGTTDRFVLLSAGELVERRWFPGPLVAAAPNQGFEVDVPAGWEARPTWKGFELRPAAAGPRGLLAGPVELTTVHLDITDWLNVTGRFPGGRTWFRADGLPGRSPTSWYVRWPYHCLAGRDCPQALARRALVVSYQVPRGTAAEAAALAERLLASARPRGNAVAGQAHAPRPACVEGRTVTTRRSPRRVAPGQVTFSWDVLLSANLIPCTPRDPVGVELLDGSGRPLPVRGNGRGQAPPVDLPERQDRSGMPRLSGLTMTWRNWCGTGPVRMRWIGPPAGGPVLPVPTPACTDPSRPSVLSVRRDPP